MSTLYELTKQYEAYANSLLDCEELTDADIEAIDGIESDIEAKVENTIKVWRNFDAEAEVFRAEAKRLTELAKRRENASERIKSRMIYVLDLAGIEKVKTTLGNVRIGTASRPTIRWIGDGDIPKQFQRIKVELDGTKALEAEKAGTLPEGFSVERTRFVAVR